MVTSAKALAASLNTLGYKAKKMSDAFKDAGALAHVDYATAETHAMAHALSTMPKEAKFAVLYGGKAPDYVSKTMGIKITFPHAKLCAILDIADPVVTTELPKHGYLLTYADAMLQWVFHGDPVAAGVPLDVKDFDKLVKGTLNPLKKNWARTETYKAVQSIAEKLDVLGPKTTPVQPKPKGILGQLPSAVVKPKETVVQMAPEPLMAVSQEKIGGPIKAVPVPENFGWEECDEAEMLNAEPIILRSAQKMYQPVKGTSGGSRYYVVAIGIGIRVAARYIDGSLSVRIEGDDFGKFKNAIQAFGFSHVSTGHTLNAYASMHLPCDQASASKALGAIVVGLGIHFGTPLPKLSKFAGKGK